MFIYLGDLPIPTTNNNNLTKHSNISQTFSSLMSSSLAKSLTIGTRRKLSHSHSRRVLTILLVFVTTTTIISRIKYANTFTQKYTQQLCIFRDFPYVQLKCVQNQIQNEYSPVSRAHTPNYFIR